MTLNKTEDEYTLYGTRIHKAFEETIPHIVRDSGKFILSAPITRTVVKRFLGDKNLIESCHEDLQGSDIFKITGYLTYWIVKLKPIQILEEDPNKEETYVNEYLGICLANAYFREYEKPQICSEALIQNLLYLLRYRTLTVRAVPLIYEAYTKGFENGVQSAIPN